MMRDIRRFDDENSHPSEDDMPKSLTGRFLIAGIQLVDPNFFRSVVFMIQHGEDGAFGLVVNKPSDRTLGSVLPEIGTDLDLPVFIGGPVQQDYLFILHGGLPDKMRSQNAVSPVPGVIFEPATKEHIRYFTEEWTLTAEEDRPRVRLFAGYAGWSPGQLERELREHSWFTHPAEADLVFLSDPRNTWRESLSRKGRYYRFVAETETMPSVN